MYTKIGSTAANGNVYGDCSLQFGKIQCYRVMAYNGGGDSGYSSEKCAAILATPYYLLPDMALIRCKHSDSPATFCGWSDRLYYQGQQRNLWWR